MSWQNSDVYNRPGTCIESLNVYFGKKHFMLYWANILFFQWIFLRLVLCRQVAPGLESKQWYSIHGWVLPLTGWGWGNKFIHVGGYWFIKVTKSKKCPSPTNN
jgi:hypothetical protein